MEYLNKINGSKGIFSDFGAISDYENNTKLSENICHMAIHQT